MKAIPSSDTGKTVIFNENPEFHFLFFVARRQAYVLVVCNVVATLKCLLIGGSKLTGVPGKFSKINKQGDLLKGSLGIIIIGGSRWDDYLER